ncbi:MAG: Nudix family hydrolase [Gammaproteobacteria bacterium]|nr:Nudix family hydrolase [Gammaproteobacteria bacterium]
MMATTVQVAVGVIVNANHEVFISKRVSDVHQANCWEFPGGKVEPDETIEAALCRELKEETGIIVLKNQFLMSIDHDYGDKQVCLHTYIVSDFSGQPSGREGQSTQWVNIDTLHSYIFPKANYSIIKTLQLPEVIQITGQFSSLHDLVNKCQRCFDQGIKFLHFRAHELDDERYLEYATHLLRLCRQRNTKLILNRTLDMFNAIDADGLHLSRHAMKNHLQRPVAIDKLFSVSCHNKSELEQAQMLVADYAFLSPVKKALSHDAGAELGLDEFSVLAQGCDIPLYALGGMNYGDLDRIRGLQGKGVATISAYWL